jgi:hypothetical protein
MEKADLSTIKLLLWALVCIQFSQLWLDHPNEMKAIWTPQNWTNPFAGFEPNPFVVGVLFWTVLLGFVFTCFGVAIYAFSTAIYRRVKRA